MQEGEPQFQNWGLQNVKMKGNEDSEEFLGLETDSELLKEILVAGSANETRGSCNFETENLFMFTGDT